MLTKEDLKQIRGIVEETVERIVDRKLEEFEKKIDLKFEKAMHLINIRFQDIEKGIEDLQSKFYMLKKQVQIMDSPVKSVDV